MPTLSIVIPAHNEEKRIKSCLESVSKHKTNDVTEVIVIDNASTDETYTLAASVPGIRVERESRKGTSSARECGLRLATGELILFLDADSLLPEGWIERGVTHFENKKTVCVSGPYTFYDLGWSWNILSLLYWWVVALPASWITGSVAVGGSMIIRRSALEQVNGFDTSVTFYGDDTNTAKRLQKVGRVIFDPFLVLQSSGRRLREQGLLRTGIIYARNFLSQLLTNKSVTSSHNDIR